MNERACNDRANELLPWYLNGSLAADEAAAVASHVASCETCAFELDGLSQLARALARHGTPTAERPRGRLLVLATAAVVGSLAILGAYRLGFHPAHRQSVQSQSGPLARVILDLGAGPMRGNDTLPTLTLAGASGAVGFRFFAPLEAREGASVELADAAGRTLGRVALPSELDPLGRVTVSFPAELIRKPGSYSVVLRDATGAGSHVLPFQVLD